VIDPATLQQQLFAEATDPRLFDRAQAYVHSYLETVFERPAYPDKVALANLEQFTEALPPTTGSAQAVLEQLHTYGAPATVPTLGGRYFGFVTGSVIPVGLAAKHMTTYWDQNASMRVMSPVAAKLEAVIQGWLRELFGLPDHTVAGFVSGTSTANLCALAAARYRLLLRQGWNVIERGLRGAPPLRIVTGRESHSSVKKALLLLGLGVADIEWVDCDSEGRLRADALPELDERSLLILQAGNVNSGSFDPFGSVCERARAAGSWVHVDGAFGLWAGAADRLRYLTQGMEHAHSWAVDGHKTLNTPYDSGIVLCADGEALATALHMSAGYLIQDEERDGMFYTPEMSRRARVFELWATLKYLGRAGIDTLVVGLHERARQFAGEIAAAAGFTVLNDVVFNQVVVACANDELTERTLARIQQLRECWVGGSTWRGRRVIRVSFCSWATTPADVTRAVMSFAQAWRDVTSA
jgi:glutamate/tyrosine decarboxylase-like PLP-dependent enzyme